MKFFITITLILNLSNSVAQSKLYWEKYFFKRYFLTKDFREMNLFRLKNIQELSNNEYMVAGTVFHQSLSNSFGHILKLDPYGDTIFTKFVQPIKKGSELIKCQRLDTNHLLLVGNKNYYGNINENSDYFVQKINFSGEIVWEVQSNHSGDTSLFVLDFIIDTKRNKLVLLTEKTETLTNDYKFKPALVILDLNTGKELNRLSFVDYSAFGKKIFLTQRGEYQCVFNDRTIKTIDSNGNILSDKKIPIEIKYSEKGENLIVYNYYYYKNNPISQQQKTDTIVNQIYISNLNGDSIVKKDFIFENNIYLEKVKPLKNGGFIGVGSMRENVFEGPKKGVAIKFDHLLNVIWIRNYDSSYYNGGNYRNFIDVIETDSMGFLFGGNIVSETSDNYYFVKTDSLGFLKPNISNKINNNFKLNTSYVKSIYPNPASNFINISMDKNIENLNLSLFNTQGLQVENYLIDKNQTEIKLFVGHLSNGIYSLVFNSNNYNIFSTKVLIQN